MPKTHGTQDDLTLEEIRIAVEDAVSQYRLWSFIKITTETQFDLVVAMALENEEPLD